jgi:hypothetical protein
VKVCHKPPSSGGTPAIFRWSGSDFSAEHRGFFGDTPAIFRWRSGVSRRRRHLRSENGHVRLGFRRNFRRVAAIFQWRTGGFTAERWRFHGGALAVSRRSTGGFTAEHRRFHGGTLAVSRRSIGGLSANSDNFSAFTGDFSAEHRQSFGVHRTVFSESTGDLSAEHRQSFGGVHRTVVSSKKTDRHSQMPIDRRNRFPLAQRLYSTTISVATILNSIRNAQRPLSQTLPTRNFESRGQLRFG